MTSFYFPHDRDYHGGTDADHVPVIPGNDFPPDASHQDESHWISQHLATPIWAKPHSAHSMGL